MLVVLDLRGPIEYANSAVPEFQRELSCVLLDHQRGLITPLVMSALALMVRGGAFWHISKAFYGVSEDVALEWLRCVYSGISRQLGPFVDDDQIVFVDHSAVIEGGVLVNILPKDLCIGCSYENDLNECAHTSEKLPINIFREGYLPCYC